MYSKRVMDLFLKPKNTGVLQGADGIGQYTNTETNDIYKLYIKVENDIITDSSFKAFCGADGIAVFSLLTEFLKRKTIEQIKDINITEVTKQLGDLGDNNETLNDAMETIKSTLIDYNKKQQKLLKEQNRI